MRAEEPIARDDAVADQKAVEVLPHGNCGGVEFVRFAGAPRAAQNLRVSAKLLMEQRDCPTARHPFALFSLNRLQRVVPVAVSVANQVGSRYETPSHRSDLHRDMRGDRIAALCSFERALAPPGDFFVQKSDVARRFDVIAQRL